MATVPKMEISVSLEARGSVLLFAKEMERVLKENDEEKGEFGWEFSSIFDLVDQLVTEHKEAIGSFCNCDPESLKKEVIDIANFCMMIWDNLDRRDRQQQTP